MIRSMVWQDLPQVMTIENDVQLFPWSQPQFEDCLNAAYWAWVYPLSDVPVAYLLALPGVDDVEILTLAVAARQQGRGLAKALLLHLKQTARLAQKSRLLLEVAANNRAALGLYQQQGFEQIGVRRAYYRDADQAVDAWVMACLL